MPTFAFLGYKHQTNVGIKKTTSNYIYLVDFSNLTFETASAFSRDSNVKFNPLAPAFPHISVKKDRKLHAFVKPISMLKGLDNKFGSRIGAIRPKCPEETWSGF